MTDAETSLAQAERHVRDGAQRVAHQEAILAELLRDGHAGQVIEAAETLLGTLRTTLELMRDDLRRERRKNGLEPGGECQDG